MKIKTPVIIVNFKTYAKGTGREADTLAQICDKVARETGKNIVIALLESHNYTVIDLGANVKTKKIIQEAVKSKPDIIALSALMTTTVLEMENVIKELRDNGINAPVIVGGAVVTDDYANEIKAAYAKDALLAVDRINELIK